MARVPGLYFSALGSRETSVCMCVSWSVEQDLPEMEDLFRGGGEEREELHPLEAWLYMEYYRERLPHYTAGLNLWGTSPSG